MILIVDDDPDHRGLVRLILEGEGHRVLEAPDGASALALLAAGLRPRLLLTDLQMPILDGRGLLAAIAQLPLAEMTTALVTGMDVGGDPELQALCSEVLRKPICHERLLALAARADGRRDGSG